MKKLFLLAVLSAFGFAGMKAQTVGDVPIRNIDAPYIQLNSSYLVKKCTVTLDFGQRTKLFALKSILVKDEKGETVVFNSLVDAINFFANYGYEVVSVTATSDNSSQCLMKNTNYKLPAKK
jgi:hypothetical protein